MRVVGVMVALLMFTAVSTAQAPAAKPESTLLQVMRAILFPNSNIIFDAQDEDPGAPKKEGAETKYGNVYGGWMAVENAGARAGGICQPAHDSWTPVWKRQARSPDPAGLD